MLVRLFLAQVWSGATALLLSSSCGRRKRVFERRERMVMGTTQWHSVVSGPSNAGKPQAALDEVLSLFKLQAGYEARPDFCRSLFLRTVGV